MTIYTDACSRRSGKGAWCFIARDQGYYCIIADRGEFTVNSAELNAVLEGARFANRLQKSPEILTDSQYCVNSFKSLGTYKERGWKTMAGKDLKNLSLLKELSLLDVDKVSWIRSHNGTFLNEAADAIAERALVIGQISLKLTLYELRRFLKEIRPKMPKVRHWLVLSSNGAPISVINSAETRAEEARKNLAKEFNGEATKTK